MRVLLLLIVVACCVATLTANQDKIDCEMKNSFDDTPICGLPDGFCGEPKTFANECDLTVYNTLNPTKQYKYFHDGKCLPTPVPGPDCAESDRDKKPICGLPDGFCGEPTTFSNKCDLEVYNTFNPTKKYKYFHDGKCLNTPEIGPDCGELDGNDEQPICCLPNDFCGEPKTFSNKCDLQVYNTFNPNEQYEYFHDGECVIASGPGPDCAELDCNVDQPICGLPYDFCGEPKTFSNKCDLEVYNTFNPTLQYEYFHDGECLSAPAPGSDCSELDCSDKPICGLPDGFCGEPKTFSNECDLEVYNTFNPTLQYEYFHDGECISAPAPGSDCGELDCSDKPICGLPDGFCGQPKTFLNECDLEVYNTFNPNQKYKLFHNGKCLDTTIPEPEPECNIVCLDSYNPICTLPDDFCGKPKTFGSECSLNAYNCKNKNQKYKKFHDGQCLTDEPKPQCNTICPTIYKPVCALPDGFCGEPKTYSSSCVLASENCVHPNEKYKYFHEGECIPQPSVCPDACTDEYEPVCATGQSGDQRQWFNKCEFDMYNCLNTDRQYTYSHNGECEGCSEIKCNKIGMPVCAINSKNELKTFGNPCALQWNNCEKPDDQYAYYYDGECSNVDPIICTTEYMPVCAFSCTLGSKTFWNKCEEDNYINQHPDEGYSHAYTGECTSSSSSCRRGCPRNYDPICGRDCSGNTKTFSNQCVFEAHNCEYPSENYAKIQDGECNPCDIICTMIYEPISCTDTSGNETTFGNSCELERYNCENPDNKYISHNGACYQCNRVCPENYEPFCATDSNGNKVTFGNQCELYRYNCENPNNPYVKIQDGECNPCDIICPMVYEPIDCSDTSGNEITFGSLCELERYNCENPDNKYISHNGACYQCNRVCTENYEPFCATDSNGTEATFGNQCELNIYNCENPNNLYAKIHDGECENPDARK